MKLESLNNPGTYDACIDTISRYCSKGDKVSKETLSKVADFLEVSSPLSWLFGASEDAVKARVDVYLKKGVDKHWVTDENREQIEKIAKCFNLNPQDYLPEDITTAEAASAQKKESGEGWSLGNVFTTAVKTATCAAGLYMAFPHTISAAIGAVMPTLGPPMAYSGVPDLHQVYPYNVDLFGPSPQAEMEIVGSGLTVSEIFKEFPAAPADDVYNEWTETADERAEVDEGLEVVDESPGIDEGVEVADQRAEVDEAVEEGPGIDEGVEVSAEEDIIDNANKTKRPTEDQEFRADDSELMIAPPAPQLAPPGEEVAAERSPREPPPTTPVQEPPVEQPSSLAEAHDFVCLAPLNTSELPVNWRNTTSDVPRSDITRSQLNPSPSAQRTEPPSSYFGIIAIAASAFAASVFAYARHVSSPAKKHTVSKLHGVGSAETRPLSKFLNDFKLNSETLPTPYKFLTLMVDGKNQATRRLQGIAGDIMHKPGIGHGYPKAVIEVVCHNIIINLNRSRLTIDDIGDLNRLASLLINLKKALLNPDKDEPVQETSLMASLRLEIRDNRLSQHISSELDATLSKINKKSDQLVNKERPSQAVPAVIDVLDVRTYKSAGPVDVDGVAAPAQAAEPNEPLVVAEPVDVDGVAAPAQAVVSDKVPSAREVLQAYVKFSRDPGNPEVQPYDFLQNILKGPPGQHADIIAKFKSKDIGIVDMSASMFVGVACDNIKFFMDQVQPNKKDKLILETLKERLALLKEKLSEEAAKKSMEYVKGLHDEMANSIATHKTNSILWKAQKLTLKERSLVNTQLDETIGLIQKKLKIKKAPRMH